MKEGQNELLGMALADDISTFDQLIHFWRHFFNLIPFKLDFKSEERIMLVFLRAIMMI